jgi:DNA-binding CsgD family transcriptional regulator
MADASRVESLTETRESDVLSHRPVVSERMPPPSSRLHESVVSPSVVMDAKGRLLDISDEYSEKVGYDRERAIGLCHPFPWCPASEVSRCKSRLALLSSASATEAGVTSMSWSCGSGDDEHGVAGGSICVAVSQPGMLVGAATVRAETRTRSRDLEAAVHRIALELARLGEAAPVLPTPDSPESCEGLELLSAREWEVLTPFLAGRRVSSIAPLLFISPHTVRNHLQSIYRKVGVRSQSELIDKLGSPQ